MTNHPWPRIMVTRKIVKDGGKILRPLRLGRRPARDDRRHPQGLSAAHLLGRGVQESRAPVHRVSDQAMPRAVLPAGRSRRVRAPSARRADAARGTKPRGAQGVARADARRMPNAWNSRRRRALRDQRARDRKDRRAPDRAPSLGHRPGRLRALSRGRLYRGDRPDGARRQADQHAGLEFPGPRIRRRGHPRRPAHAILLGRALSRPTR